jgi:ubiquinone/menaquinone biosynthesis C-methylase UbiE
MNQPTEHERCFQGSADRLRTPERLALLERDRVLSLSVAGITARNVLDVGTGTGVFAEVFSMASLRVYGIDISTERMAVARKYVPQAEFLEALAEAIPFENLSFDLVFMGLLLHEADDPVKALKEAKRLSRLQVMILEWPFREEKPGPPLEHRLSPQWINEMALNVGFSHVERITLNYLELYRLMF